jgi:CRISPR-associated protein Cmr6
MKIEQSPITQTAKKQKKVITIPITGGGGGNRDGANGGGGGNGGNNQQPSAWLMGTLPEKIDPSASFVEYLRWMRSPNEEYKDATKSQILQMSVEGRDYHKLLQLRNDRTKKIAHARQGDYWQVMCPWRMRVGGHRGPESILLPAFDALGVPYIPSSSLRGAARTAAIREFMDQGMNWENAEKMIAQYFGSINDSSRANQSGKVVFLDAYPLASKSAGVAMDMANSIWRWEENQLGNYSPNPNSFLSLKETTILIGICRMPNCSDEIFNRVKRWLVYGLQQGIGSQINSGYGELLVAGEGAGNQAFFEVDFELEGQLIHGSQKFNDVHQPFQKERNGDLKRDRKGNLKTDQKAVAEVRSIAFKSMLRYWFRAISRGFMSTQDAKTWEAKIFGAINPQNRGWITFRIQNGKTVNDTSNDKNKDVGLQTGILSFHFSSECPAEKKKHLENLIKNLTWLMFSLGGVGQGARRPCYSRQNRPNPPWWRGATLYVSSDQFWQFPNTVQDFQVLFRTRLHEFCDALNQISQLKIDLNQPQQAGRVGGDCWQEVLDINCRILVCSGENGNNKPYALSVLHSDQFKKNGDYDSDLCGSVRGQAKPSPVWINDQNDYQVVTVFGANQNPRKDFISKLKGAIQIFPIT